MNKKIKEDLEKDSSSSNSLHSASMTETKASRFEDLPEQISEIEKNKNRLVDPSILASTGRKTVFKSKWDLTESTSGFQLIPAIQGRSDPSTDSYFDSEKNPDRKNIITSQTFNQTPTLPLQQPSIDPRNSFLSDQQLNEILPTEGYIIIPVPSNYRPTRITNSILLDQGNKGNIATSERTAEELPAMTEEDKVYFGSLLVPEEGLTGLEKRERKVLTFLLKIKNGTSSIRKNATKDLLSRAIDLGADSVLKPLLSLLQLGSFDEWERHLLIKILDRLFFVLKNQIDPFTAKILQIFSPLLTDENNYIRAEGRELVSNLAKAVGLGPIANALRPDVDNTDEKIRGLAARILAIVVCALGWTISSPFIRAMCNSKKSWRARQCGYKTLSQLAVLQGSGVLGNLVAYMILLERGMVDEHLKVKTTAALAISSMIDSCSPYGLEAFEGAIKVVWEALNSHRGKPMAAFLRAAGGVLSLMEGTTAEEYSTLLLKVLLKEFDCQEEQIQKAILKVLTLSIDKGASVEFLREEILEPFFINFWVRRICSDRFSYKLLIKATTKLSSLVGSVNVLRPLTAILKEDSEILRRAALESCLAIFKTNSPVLELGFEELLLDSALSAFHQQQTEDGNFMLRGFCQLIAGLGLRAARYYPSIVANICVRLRTRSSSVRIQAGEMTANLAEHISECEEKRLLGNLYQLFCENLGEEFPEVLASILKAIQSLISVLSSTTLNPALKDLLPSLTPILQNKHPSVQNQLVTLISQIAKTLPEDIDAREWIRVCFDLIDLLQAPIKATRRSTVLAFGMIAQAIGPQDVLSALLNNLKINDRQMKIGTTVAIAIVADSCGPFTVLPALMNEYRAPSQNIQNGVLKALSFMFEYIGEGCKDYVWPVTSLLENALIDRDLVHRQTAATILSHICTGAVGFGHEDCIISIFNKVLANLFETTPHVVNAVTEAFEGVRVAVGPGHALLYIIQGLFHPAKKVRDPYWKLFDILYIGSQDSLVPFYPLPENKGSVDSNEGWRMNFYYQI